MKKILGVSLVALMAVSTARADIASTAYVDAHDTSTLTSAQGYTDTQIGTLGTWDNNGTPTAYTDVKDYVDRKVGEVASDVSELGLSSLGVTATAAELNVLDGITATTAELNILDGVTADASEINVLDGITATTADLNQLSGKTLGTAAEANVATGTGAAGITDDGTGLVTADQVFEYVAANAGASNFIAQTISDAITNKAPSEDAVHDALALKQDASTAVTHTANAAVGSATQTVYVDTDGSVKAGTTLGTIATHAEADYATSTFVGTIPGNSSATSIVGYIDEQVGDVDTGVMAVTEGATNGTIAVDGTDVPVHGLNSAAYTASTAYLPAVASSTTGTDGEYVLTMKVVDGAQTLKWETITRNNP